MPDNPNTQLRQLRSVKFRETEWFYLFNDAEIDLKSKFHWDSNNVVQIDLHLTNIGTRKFKICSLQRCKGTYPHPLDDYVLIHLSTHTDEDESSITVDIDTLDLYVGKKQLFLFKESILDCHDSYSCELGGPTPQTKDGSIIVSI